MTLEQLARLLGRSYRTARGLRDRWCNAGWTKSAKLAVDLPPFVWLTGRGTRLVQAPFRTWDANPGLAAHIEAVTNVRFALERELHLGAWECERSIAQRHPSRSDRRAHLPDGILAGQRRIAIEVELNLKSRSRMQSILYDLSSAYQHTWYFAPERLLPTLTDLASEAPYANVAVYRYPPLPAQLARGEPNLSRT